MLQSKLGSKMQAAESVKHNMPSLVKIKKMSAAEQAPSVFGNMLNSSSKVFQQATQVDPRIG